MMGDEVNRDLGRLEGRLEELIQTRAAHDKQTDERFDRLEAKVQLLLDAANMGKGAWWLLLKVGGVMTAFVAMLSWAFDKMRF